MILSSLDINLPGTVQKLKAGAFLHLKMLRSLPHPNLLPTQGSSSSSSSTTKGIAKDDWQITPPSRTALRPWKTHQRSSTTTTDFTSILPFAGSVSPSRSSTFLPFFNLAKEQSNSPEPVSPEEAAEYDPRLVRPLSVQANVDPKPGKLANWFSGTSEPVNITLIPSPAKEKHDPFFDSTEMERGSPRSSTSQDMDNINKRPQSRLQKSTSSFSVVGKDLAGSNKFSFWKSRHTSSLEKANQPEDELTALNIHTTLFPSGNGEESSPEAFKRLQVNAESTISRLQIAYQKNLQLVREITSEKNILTDELDAANTRSEHLKLQLANMAAQSAEQESAMQAMAEELAALRHKIREDSEFRSRTLRIVPNDFLEADEADSATGSPYRGRRERPFAESESESIASEDDSVFSHAPPGTCTPFSAVDSSPEQLYSAPAFDTSPPVKECQNCHGVKRSEAWDVVHLLQEENRALKTRITECESANEDALKFLDIVSAMR